METNDLLVYILKPSKNIFSTFFHFFLTIISLANSFLLYCKKKNVNTNVMATFLSSIKNFTLDCTRYYDKTIYIFRLKTFFFPKAATDTILYL